MGKKRDAALLRQANVGLRVNGSGIKSRSRHMLKWCNMIFKQQGWSVEVVRGETCKKR